MLRPRWYKYKNSRIRILLLGLVIAIPKMFELVAPKLVEVGGGHVGPLTIFVAGLLLVGVIEHSLHETQDPRGELGHRRFAEAYSETLHDIITGHEDRAQQSDVVPLVKACLIGVCAVVRSIYHDEQEKKNGIGVNANYMHGLASDLFRETDRPMMKFVDRHRTLASYAHFLALFHWAETSRQLARDLVLPVDSDPGRVLFGAPVCFDRKEIIVIRDVKDEKELSGLLKGQPETIALEVKGYFLAQAEMRSLVCIPIKNKNGVVGVLNVHSQRAELFGEQSRPNQELLTLLKPFCAILGLLASQIGEQINTSSQRAPLSRSEE